MEDPSPLLHVCHNHNYKLFNTVTRSHALLHIVALFFLIYYRFTFLLQDSKTRLTPALLPWLLVFASELLHSFLWLLSQASRLNPVSRTVFPERLPEDDKLPAIDVFVFTADPNKEPTVEVMNTVLSAMALDYPAEKLHVYLSDDGGAAVTLYGMREAWRFARFWLPFCNKFGIKTRCPHAFFSSDEAHHYHLFNISTEFAAEMENIQEKYERMKQSITAARENGWPGDACSMGSSRDHPPVIEVINEKCNDDIGKEEEVQLPLLVYVSREKRPSHPHYFKAGAINTLLRVSGVISNSPYILMLDCDMYCNDATSARQAMCFLLHPHISPSLAFVQFPQLFNNVAPNDIYDCAVRYIFKLIWYGLDGLQGPVLSGTNFYIKRKALYGKYMHEDMEELKNSFGRSIEFIKSLHRDHCNPCSIRDIRDSSTKLLQEIKILASRTYEHHTNWGQKVGFMYETIGEDFVTGFTQLHCKGWKSVYLNPSRPAFLGTASTNLNDLLVQGTRWSSALVQSALARSCPLIYKSLNISFLQRLCYSELSFFPLFYCFPLLCFATIPQLCLLYGIPLYPEVSDPYFFLFPLILISALSQHLFEVLFTGGSVQMMRNEHRMWMIKSVTCHLCGSLTAILEKLNMGKVQFLPTNKVTDDEQVKLYQMGIFDFRTSTMFLAPLATIIILNTTSFSVGLIRILVAANGDGGDKLMLAQVLLSFYVVAMNYPVVEGMFLRKDKGRIPPSVTLLSAIITMVLLVFGYVILIY